MKWHVRLTRDIASMIPHSHPNIPPSKYIMYGIPIGTSEFLNMPVCIDLNNLIAPTGIFVGKIGTGKSTSAKAMLYRQHHIFGTPIIIFDAHGEYSPEVSALGGTVIDMVDQTINPCKRDAELTEDKKAIQLADMLETIFEFSDIQRAVLMRYIKKGYEKFGEEFSFQKLTQMISFDFDKRLPDSKTLGALATRFEILADNIFGEENSIALDDLTRGLVCVDVSKIDNNHLRNIVMLSILQHIYNSMLSQQKDHRESEKIQLLIMIDEAGRLASADNSVATRLVKESRKFQIGLFFGIQDIPDIDSKILSNYGFVFVHKLDNQEYITKIQNDCSFSQDQAARIRFLPVGTAFLRLNFKDSRYHSPFVVRVLKEEIQGVYAESGQKQVQITKQDKISKIRDVHKVETTLDQKSKLSELEDKLLQSIKNNETSVVTEHYNIIGVNEYQGNKIRQSLEKSGYISSFNLKNTEKRGKILRLTKFGEETLGITRTKRNGNSETKVRIDEIKTKLESLGHGVIKEYSLGSGKQTDLVVNGQVAIEYDSENVKESNIRKNLQHGFQKIIQICRDSSQVDNFVRDIDELDLGEDRSKITVVDYKTFLQICSEVNFGN